MKFEDIYISPTNWCHIASRKDVITSNTIAGMKLEIPVISSNMDTVYSPALAQETAKAGGISIVHRFCDIPTNIRLFEEGILSASYNSSEASDFRQLITKKAIKPWVSVGTNNHEWTRCKALLEAGAEIIVVDVANAACDAALNQFLRIKNYSNAKVVVGNFCTFEQIKQFISKSNGFVPDALKIAVGVGGNCLTERFTVGAGTPPLQTVIECKKAGIPLIYDGGMSCPADFNKAMIWCDAVIMGRQFAGTFESAGDKHHEICDDNGKISFIKCSITDLIPYTTPTHSYYRGSAAADSYVTQGKVAPWRAVEGKGSYVEITGTVAQVVQEYGVALRSAMTYCDSNTIEEFHSKAKWGLKNELTIKQRDSINFIEKINYYE